MRMKYWFYIFLIISIPAFAKPVLNIQHWVTKNGTEVLFIETHALPILDIQITFNAGSAQDGENFGIAQFTNAMLEEGTKNLTADQIANSFDQVGAAFHADVDRDMATVSLRSLTTPRLLNPALATFTKVVTEPMFKEKSFHRVQKQILSAITEQQQQPMAIANNAFWKNLYGDAPYGHPVIGTKESISALTTKDLRSFYQKYYCANNATIAIVGDVSLRQAKKIVEQIIGKLPKGAAAHKLASIPKASAKAEHVKFPSAQTNIFIGQVGIARNSPDYFPLLVGNYILGQSPLTSELFQEVRNRRGLAYSINSDFITLQTDGPFYIIMQTRPEEAQKAINISLQTLSQFIDQGPSKNQLNAAKQSLIGRFPLQIASNEEIISILSLIGFYHLPLNYLDTYINNISNVTLEQIQAAFKKHIQAQKMVIITVGKKNAHS
jgi:zinc protease